MVCVDAALVIRRVAFPKNYLAVCERMGVELWTSDQRLANTLKAFQIEWVRGVGVNDE
jgi:hypothetical protein